MNNQRERRWVEGESSFDLVTKLMVIEKIKDTEEKLAAEKSRTREMETKNRETAILIENLEERTKNIQMAVEARERAAVETRERESERVRR